MTNIQIWVGDLAEYNNGNLYGEWITLPMEYDEIMKRCLKEGNEEWEIMDTDCEFDIKGLSLNELNELAEKLDSLQEHEKEVLIAIMDSGNYSDIEGAIQCLEDGEYMMYHNCKDMSDVAYHWYEETGQLAELEKVASHIVNYIDWEMIGRDMEIEGNFYRVDYETYIQIW